MCAPGHSFELNPFYPIGFEHCSTGCPEKTAGVARPPKDLAPAQRRAFIGVGNS